MTDRHLAMLLAGPMQSWGHASRYGRRNTLAFPTRSGIIGILSAALGADKGDMQLLSCLNDLRYEVLALSPTRRVTDFHTVGGGYSRAQRSQIPPKADGGTAQTVVTRREYLMDARFGVVVSGDGELINRCDRALNDPVWGVWLGRKACIPTEPISQGVFDDSGSAESRLIEASRGKVSRRICEADRFEDGTDSLMDLPLDFETRSFGMRRINDESV